MLESSSLERHDWKRIGGIAGLLAVAVLIPQAGRIGGTGVLGTLKAVLVVACIFAPATVLGYSHRSPLVAYLVSYGFLSGVDFATGMHNLVVGAPESELLSILRMVVFNILRAGVVFVVGYSCGYLVEYVRRSWFASGP